MTAPAEEAPPVSAAEAAAARNSRALSGAFTQLTTDRHRDPKRLSISGLAGCTRRAAYQVAGTLVSNIVPIGEDRAANLGTIEHDALVPAIAAQLGGTYEQYVTLKAAGLEIHGRYDVWVEEFGDLLDLKTLAQYKLTAIRKFGMYRANRIQGLSYGLALRQEGADVRTVSMMYMDRASGADDTLVMDFTRGHALRIIDRVEEIVFHANSPDAAPRDPGGRKARVGPGWSFECDGCPWLRRCWGPDAEAGNRYPASLLAADADDIEQVCADLADAKRRESDAKKEVEYYRARLRDAPEGNYGAWKLSRYPGHLMPDQTAMRESLEANDLPVPMMTTATRVDVKPVAATKKGKANRAGDPGQTG